MEEKLPRNQKYVGRKDVAMHSCRHSYSYLNVVISVVVKVEDPIELAVNGDVDVLGVLDSLAQRLSGVLFHLDVVKLPGTEHGVNYFR